MDIKEEFIQLRRLLNKRTLTYSEFNELIGNYYVKEYEELEDNYYLLKIIDKTSKSHNCYTDYIEVLI